MCTGRKDTNNLLWKWGRKMATIKLTDKVSLGDLNLENLKLKFLKE